MSMQHYGGGDDRQPARRKDKGFFEALFASQAELEHDAQMDLIHYRGEEVATQDFYNARRTREMNRYSTALTHEAVQMTNSLCDEVVELAGDNRWKFEQMSGHVTDASNAMRARNRDFNVGQ